MPTVVDLFSGGGGMSLGFQNAGFNVIAAFENWAPAIKCYRNNFNHPIYKLDLSNVPNAVQNILPLRPDIIIGGPPCQDFSQAGNRIEGARADLTIDYATIISNVRPKLFVMENVERVRKSHVYQTALNIYRENGYHVSEIVLDASLCNVPQKRKRFFCIGSLIDQNNEITDFLTSNLSTSHMTVRDYLGDKLGVEAYYRHPRNYNRRGIFSIDEPAPTIRGVNRPIPPGYTPHKNDKEKDLSKVRPLTSEERAWLQTFPETFIFEGTKTDIEQIIGNAVPVNLAQFVATGIMNFYNNHFQTVIDFNGFDNWLQKNKHYTERTISDVKSRIRRANSISPITENHDLYLFYLDSEKEFASLSNSVKSQIRRALKTYFKYLKESSELTLF